VDINPLRTPVCYLAYASKLTMPIGYSLKPIATLLSQRRCLNRMSAVGTSAMLPVSTGERWTLQPVI
jgi:hypothetical protein